ncbi:MAG: hypothetical protein EBZ47_00715 [Chlamydiae bacterium]|nr:hypothetical protein [Chlamydiota bacterium]
MNKFEDLIYHLGEVLGIDLHAERGRVCKLHIDGKIHLHLEYDESKDLLLLASLVCEVPPGKFRENVFKEALKINDSFPRIATIAFSEKGNQLALFDYLSFVYLDVHKLNSLMHAFLDYAFEWKRAIESGNLNSIALPPSSSMHSSIFGVKK